LEHTLEPLPTGYNGIPFIVGQGIAWGVLLGCVVIFLEFQFSLWMEPGSFSAKKHSWISSFAADPKTQKEGFP